MIPAPRAGASPRHAAPSTRAVRTLSAITAVALSLGACAQPQSSGRSRADASTIAACRQRADDVYKAQNRGDVYRADSFATNDRDSPFATTGLPGITSAGLSGRYQHAQFEDQCLASSGIGAANSGSSGGLSPSSTASPGPSGQQSH